MFDYDNDGWLDLMTVNGHVYRAVDKQNWGTTWAQRPLLMHNVKGKLQVVPAVEGTGLAKVATSRGMAYGDLFNDGRVDVVVNNMDSTPSVFRNVTEETNHWVEFRLVGGPKSPRDATGATMWVTAEGFRQRQDVIAGGSFASSPDKRAALWAGGGGQDREGGGAMAGWNQGDAAGAGEAGCGLHSDRGQGNAGGGGAMSGRVALVTGASRGLGAAMAEALAEAGHPVAVNYFQNGERAEMLCAGLRERGLRAEAFGADVRDEVAVRRMVAEVESRLGPVEVVVANATGHQPMLAIEEQSWDAYLQQMEFFVKSPLLLLQAVLPGMRERGWGRMIQIGSEVVELGNPRFANYVAAKAAQLGQTRSWARELGPTGITVNLLAPGWIPTERSLEATDEDKRAYVAGVPLRRMGEAVEVGRVVAFLASDAASFMTGQKIAVNGGNTLE